MYFPLRKALLTGLWTAAALGAVIGPSLLAVDMVREYGLRQQREQAQVLAQRLLGRIGLTADRLLRIHRELVHTGGSSPCAPYSTNLMQQQVLRFPDVRAVAYVEQGRVICSSLGDTVTGVDLGPSDFTTGNRISVWNSAVLPAAPETPFRVFAKEGYAIIMERESTNQLGGAVPQAMAAVSFSGTAEDAIVWGELPRAWFKRAGENTTFVDDKYVVAVQRSTAQGLVALAAVASSPGGEALQRLAILLVPLSAAAGLGLLVGAVILARRQFSLPQLIRSGLRRNEFYMVYQPIVEVGSGRCVGLEALIRWRRRNGDLIAPDVFIDEAERVGLIGKITERVFGLVSSDVQRWRGGLGDLYISINVSAADMASGAAERLLSEMFARTGLTPSQVVVELTERALLHSDEAVAAIKIIRKMGVRVAIDDFGTGYSSLAYLTSFEVDGLKIDKRFVDAIGRDAPSSSVSVHIIEMAKSLGLRVVAEGVETAGQQRFLSEHGVDYAQGWLFGRPMPLNELLAMARRPPPG